MRFRLEPLGNGPSGSRPTPPIRQPCAHDAVQSQATYGRQTRDRQAVDRGQMQCGIRGRRASVSAAQPSAVSRTGGPHAREPQRATAGSPRMGGHAVPRRILAGQHLQGQRTGLQSRGLVKVAKRRRHWSAQLTDLGRAYLTAVETGLGERSGGAPEASGRYCRLYTPNCPAGPDELHRSAPQRADGQQLFRQGGRIRLARGELGIADSAARRSGKILAHRSSSDNRPTAATRSSSPTSPPGV